MESFLPTEGKKRKRYEIIELFYARNDVIFSSSYRTWWENNIRENVNKVKSWRLHPPFSSLRDSLDSLKVHEISSQHAIFPHLYFLYGKQFSLLSPVALKGIKVSRSDFLHSTRRQIIIKKTDAETKFLDDTDIVGNLSCF